MECRLKYGAPLTNLSASIVPEGAEPRAASAAAAPPPPPPLSGRIECLRCPLAAAAPYKPPAANQLSAATDDQYAVLAAGGRRCVTRAGAKVCRARAGYVCGACADALPDGPPPR